MAEELTITDLSVVIGERQILDFGTRITIESGDVIAVLGPNGAGKTTLVNCLIDQIPYTGNITKDAPFRNLGILFQNNNYGSLMKVKELISIVTQKNLSDSSVASMVEEFDLGDLLNSRIGKLSQGELQRFSLALVLFRDSDFLIFDELTTGLDFEKRAKLLNMVKSKTSSKTVLVVTHYFEEIVGWANKILMIEHGNIAFWGTVSEFKNQNTHDSVLLTSPEAFDLINETTLQICGVVVIEHYEDTLCAYISQDKVALDSIATILEEHDVRYMRRPPDFYSMYRFAQARRGKHA